MMIHMTKMLEEAIKKVRELPAADQDEAAAILMTVASRNDDELVELDDDTREAIRVGREQAQRGEFVSDKHMAAFFRRHGVTRYGA